MKKKNIFLRVKKMINLIKPWKIFIWKNLQQGKYGEKYHFVKKYSGLFFKIVILILRFIKICDILHVKFSH